MSDVDAGDRLPHHLVERWTRLTRSSVPFAFGCACGGAVGHVRAQDFEADLIAYLQLRVVALEGAPRPDARTLVEFLQSLRTASAAVHDALLRDADRAIRSWERSCGVSAAAGRFRSDPL